MAISHSKTQDQIDGLGVDRRLGQHDDENDEVMGHALPDRRQRLRATGEPQPEEPGQD